MKRIGQLTLAHAVKTAGVGLHSGLPVSMTLKPAEEFTGIVFYRTDETPGANAITASAQAVCDTDHCTTLVNEHGVKVSTVEHIMAAFHATGIDNALVELSGPEVPILDGSAEPFMKLLKKAGTMRQDDPKKAIRVLRQVQIEEDNRHATVAPAENFSLEIAVDYNHPALPPQEARYTLADFAEQLAAARTFCLEPEVEQLRAHGLIKGGSLENAVVMGEQGPLNPEGLRFPDEVIRHKALDCLGDFYMTGYPILGVFSVKHPGHGLNNRLLRALLDDKTAWEWV